MITTLVDTHLEAVGPTKSTWFSPLPLARIDHIFHSKGLNPKAAGVVRSRLAKVASDHVPLVVELAFPKSGTTERPNLGLEAEAVVEPLAFPPTYGPGIDSR